MVLLCGVTAGTPLPYTKLCRDVLFACVCAPRAHTGDAIQLPNEIAVYVCARLPSLLLGTGRGYQLLSLLAFT